LKPENLKYKEYDSNYGPNGYSELHAEVHESVDLTASIEIELDDGVVPVEVNELLEKK